MTNRFIISIGCNVNCEVQMSRVKEMLKKHFPDVTFSQIVKSPDYTNNVGAPYSNCVAKGTTILSETDLVATLKSMERQLGRTQSEQIMMDLDLLQFNNTRHHLADWSRPHIKRLLSILLILIIGITYAFPRTPPSDADNKAARELLIKATEYFQGSKYHEAVLCFEKLQERYTLTPRYLAYLGFSYYKEGEYEDAAEILLPLLSDTTQTATLTALSPKEQSVYLYACGESLFHTGDYNGSLALHERMLYLVSGLDKADVLFHIGMAYYMQGNYATAIPPLEEAFELYRSLTIPSDELHSARLSQIDKMLPGLKHEVNQITPQEQFTP